MTKRINFLSILKWKTTRLVVIQFLFKFLSFELLFVSMETSFLSPGIQKSNKIQNFESHSHSRFYLIIELVSEEELLLRFTTSQLSLSKNPIY